MKIIKYLPLVLFAQIFHLLFGKEYPYDYFRQRAYLQEI
jgi:hypothetical protein